MEVEARPHAKAASAATQLDPEALELRARYEAGPERRKLAGIVLGVVAFILTAARIQFGIVLGLELTPPLLIMPIVVGLVLGSVLATAWHFYRRADMSAALLALEQARNERILARLEELAALRSEQLRETESQLLGHQKFAALGRMSAGIAHDFNNLLTTINLGAQELAFPDLSEAEREALIAAIVQACERGAGITRQLQASSAAQLSRPELVDLGELVAKDLGVWRTLAGAEVRVEGVLPDEALPVRVDPAQFHRVLLNLVVNACQAMGESGELTLSAGRRGPGEVFVSVADTGGGIPPSVAERMFEPFFTTRETGTGLGLAVVRGVVVQAGGSIDYALAGGGTIFTVVLPEADPNETPPDDPFGRSGPRSAFSRVALVDGDPAIRQIVQRQLERMGHEVRSFATPGELLAGESRYDLLITAIELPGLSGPELALGLREARRIHRVLLLGGTVSERARESLDKLADAPVLPKPFGAGELGQMLERMLSD